MEAKSDMAIKELVFGFEISDFVDFSNFSVTFEFLEIFGEEVQFAALCLRVGGLGLREFAEILEEAQPLVEHFLAYPLLSAFRNRVLASLKKFIPNFSI